VVFGLLFFARQTDRIYRFVAAHGLALIITVFVFFFFPARAAFAHYLPSESYVPVNALSYGHVISALRGGSLQTIDFTKLDGIITFPSFHAAMAVVFAWAAWPVWWARIPMVVANVLMWLAAVPIGGHYAIDLLGGSVISIIAIVAVDRIGKTIAAIPDTGEHDGSHRLANRPLFQSSPRACSRKMKAARYISHRSISEN
jgi:membrane-associated phospholipid phosphatase